MTNLYAHWHFCDNFGDMLTPYLIEKISHKKPTYSEPNIVHPIYYVTGSLLGSNLERGIVWGIGSAYAEYLTKVNDPTDEFVIIASRGRLSKEILETRGHRPKAFGDPGILLPMYYTPKTTPKYDVGIICSWVDFEDVKTKYGAHIPVINSMTASIEHTIDQIYECKSILCSCLHGLVAAVAYGLPTKWVKFSDRMVGDGFKFRDFLTTTTTDYNQPVELGGPPLGTDQLIKLTTPHPLLPNLSKELLECCPFKFAASE